MKLKIATSQFPISSDIEKNKTFILEQIKEASEQFCDVIHFPEGSLSGYAGIDFDSFSGFNWVLLKDSTRQIMEYAKKRNIWLVLGSAHRLSNNNKPHNSLYLINKQGIIIDRYDKLFCAGDDSLKTGDLAHYTPGNHFTIFEINKIKCAVLICHDYRYPELYRELKLKGVELVFHSYRAGNMDKARQNEMESEIESKYHKFNPGKTYPEITMPATMISYAANNYLWISCSNTSAAQSCWPAFMLRPDGVTIGRLEKNQKGILLTEIDTRRKHYDSTQHWRNRAIKGQYYSGNQVNDKRSENRTEL